MTEKEVGKTRSLAAVVVTFNRSAKLRKVLDALLIQTRKPDQIYVIDNASTDDTRDVVESFGAPTIRYVRLAENIGGAGGFNAGMRLAYEEGHDYFWISDDDAYPGPDAIKILEDNLEAFDQRTQFRAPFACSRVDWTDGTICNMNNPETAWDWPRWYRRDWPVFLVESCSFVSVLVSRWAVEKHGLPIKEYFLWYDDVEYTLRLSKSYPGLYCPESQVIHDTPQNKGADLAQVTEDNLWKFRYGVRNQASRQFRDRGLFGFLAYAYNVRSTMLGGKVPSALRFKIYASLMSGYRFRPNIEKI